MGKVLRRTRNILVAGAVLTWGAYHESPRLGYRKHATQNELINNLELKNKLNSDTLYKTDDWETNVILNMMSGYKEKNEFQKLLQKYGQDRIKIDMQSKPDPALYKTIWQMHQKYGNPHITFRGSYVNYETKARNVFLGTKENVHENTRERYDLWDNEIRLQNIDSIKLDFSSDKTNDSNFKSMIYTTDGGSLPSAWYENSQRYLINKWIAEISHAKQNVDGGTIKMALDGTWSYIASWFRYKKTYHQQWAQEYKAHSVIEPELVKEFIDLYCKNADHTNGDVCLFIAMLHNGYFDLSSSSDSTGRSHPYYDAEKTTEYLLEASRFGNVAATFLLGKRGIYNFQQLYTNTPTSTELTDTEKIAERDKALSSGMSYLEIAARRRSYHAIFTIVGIVKWYDLPQYLDKAIHRQRHLIEHIEEYRKDPSFSTEICNEYMTLSELYSKKNDQKNAQHYLDLAKKNGFDFTAYYAY